MAQLTNTITVSQYLSLPHTHPSSSIQPGALTTSVTDLWDWANIDWVEPWSEFSSERLNLDFDHLLNLQLSPQYTSESSIPDAYIRLASELHVEIFLHLTILKRVNTALQAVRQHQLLGVPHLAVSPACKERANRPDLLIYDLSHPNHIWAQPYAAGDIKPAAKWSHTIWKSADGNERRQFRQVLAQINYYMRQRRCRFAMVLSEQELVTVKRMEGYKGALRVSEPFPIITNKNIQYSGLISADLALFGLALLAEQYGLDNTDESDNIDYPAHDPFYPSEESEPALSSSLSNQSSEDYMPSSSPPEGN